MENATLEGTVPSQTSNGLGMNGEQTAEFPCTCKVILAHHLHKKGVTLKYGSLEIVDLKWTNCSAQPVRVFHIITTTLTIKSSIGLLA